MRRLIPAILIALTLIAAGSTPALARPAGQPRPGAPGIGDPYFPGDGNGGYDVRHYDLNLRYFPDTDRLQGIATIKAKATQALSAFNLDLNGLRVNAIRVDGRPATWRHLGDELTVTPRRALTKGSTFTVVIAYGGIPKVLDEPALGESGVFPTPDGALIVGQPHVADTWFPVNDHPLDKATYQFKVTVPRGLEVVANGYLAGVKHHKSTSTWTWIETAPMASYLATATIGQFQLTSRRVNGIRYWDAIDPTLFDQPKPRTGKQYAISGGDDSSYKRLSREFTVPPTGGRLSFWVTRDTEPDWDFFFVEARQSGSDSWTTLPDANGHTEQSTGGSCPYWLTIHPFLAHYQTEDHEEGCTPTGSTGAWHAASGSSDGYEQWTVDLTAYAGQKVEIALAVAGDDSVAYNGVYVDDVVGPNGQGSTSFEADGNPMDGWQASGPPAGSPSNASDWRVATKAAGPSTGDRAAEALGRQPEIIQFLSGYLGRYPFGQAGGIVDNDPDIGFALENQTRPIYAKAWFERTGDNTSVVVHELAHQWTGDDLALSRWRDIWLNEGFATYMEWLWAEHQGDATAQEIFDSLTTNIPADDEFWTLRIGDPGADHIFDGPVYARGAMTLHALRGQIGDAAFFRLLKRWTASQSSGNVDTAEFQALAERVSGQDLDDFFRVWLFTPTKPSVLPTARTRVRTQEAIAPELVKLLAHGPRR